MERGLPGCLKIAFEPALPVILDDVMRALVGLCLENGNDFVRRFTPVERLHQGLLNGYCSVKGCRIGPGLEVVGLRDVPMAPLGSFIEVTAKPNDHPGLSDCLLEIEGSWSGVDRIAAQNHQHLDASAVQIAREFLDGVSVLRFDTLDQTNRGANIAQGRVNGIGCQWTLSGWNSPGITTQRPLALCRSCATALSHSGALPGASAPLHRMPSPVDRPEPGSCCFLARSGGRPTIR